MGLDKEGWEVKQREIMPSIRDNSVSDEQLDEWLPELVAQVGDLEKYSKQLIREYNEIKNLEDGAEKNKIGTEF